MASKLLVIHSDVSAMSRLKRWVFFIFPPKLSVYLFRKFIDDNRERNNSDAVKFVIDGSNLYPTRYFFLVGRSLRFSLALGGVSLPKPYVRKLVKSLMKTRGHHSRRNYVCEQISYETLKLSPQQTSSQGWKLISLTLAGFGFIRACSVVRNHCFTEGLKEVLMGAASDRTTSLVIKGLLERRRFEEARQLIEKQSTQSNLQNSFEAYSDYLALLKQRRPQVESVGDNVKSEAEILFSELVAGKTIAIVAPGEIEKELGQEIDSHDTVIRVKFSGRSAMPNERFVGRRCDITSHNFEILALSKLNKIDSKKFVSDAPDLKLIVVKKGEFREMDGIPIKRMSNWPPTFLTTATSGTMLIFETLKYAPKSVKLYGFDFYTNPRIYNSPLLKSYKTSEYPDGGVQNDFSWHGDYFAPYSIARSHLSHDLKSDFLLVKNLYELSGLIDGTPEVLEILNLTADEYDARLEEMLGDW